jgi:hypothetical protein
MNRHERMGHKVRKIPHWAYGRVGRQLHYFFDFLPQVVVSHVSSSNCDSPLVDDGTLSV